MKKPKKPPKKVVKTTLKENIGKALIDLGKLIFASVFLGGILRGDIPQDILTIGGFVAAMASLTVGVLLVTRKEEKNGETTSRSDDESFPTKKE